jgi:hypothetical protein
VKGDEVPNANMGNHSMRALRRFNPTAGNGPAAADLFERLS